MLANIGIPGLVLILIVALLLFGPSKLPQIGAAFGQTLRDFKKSSEGTFDEKDDLQEEKKQ